MSGSEIGLLFVLGVVVLPASLIYGAARLLGASKKTAWGVILAIAAAVVLYAVWVFLAG